MRRVFKILIMAALDLLFVAVALWLAGEVRFAGRIPREEALLLMGTLPFLWAGRLIGITTAGGYAGWSWRYADAEDLKRLGLGVGVGTLLAWAGIYLLGWTGEGVSRFVLLAELLFSFMLLGSYRFALRLAPTPRSIQSKRISRRRVLIVGAGEAGEMTLREIRRHPDSDMEVAGFIDDDPSKRGTVIHGARVLGGRSDIATVAAEKGVEEILIAIPSAPGGVIREIVEACRQARLRFRVVPAVLAIIKGEVAFRDIREFRVEDLLGRETAEVDLANRAHVIRGKRILVTGAAGSIGSEIARQLLRLGPDRLLLLDQSEENLFHLGRELAAEDERVRVILASIRDQNRMERLFQDPKERPEIIYHAAAYKHVPMVEMNPAEAVATNVLATHFLARLAARHGVERFVIVSSDKAVNPTSVMGASKFLAEQAGHAWHERAQGKTSFCAVRFGNVLASSGSVVPLFEEQIRRGGPVTVTHPEVVRYFMTIPEAVTLVLAASFLSEGDEVFLLEMGQAVRILDLAREMIILSGLRPEVDIPIVFTGLRPGEKLYEELLVKGENAERTPINRVYKARRDLNETRGHFTPDEFDAYLEDLKRWCEEGGDLRKLLKRGVPTYRAETEGAK